MSSDLLVELLQALDGPQHRFHQYETYYRGKQALQFVSPESANAIGKRLSRLVVNIPKLSVDALAERLRVLEFDGVNVYDEWIANDLDQLSGLVHRSALLYSQSFVTVWADLTGKPRVSVESPREVQVITDPGSRETISAVKRYRTKTTTEAYVYLADRIEHHRANTPGAATAGFELVETIDNPLGRVPVVRFLNSSLIGEGESEIEPVMALTDALSKITTDMLTASEFLAKPRRWATGVEAVERPVLDGDGNPVIEGGEPVTVSVNPFPDTDKMMITENELAKFGQLSGSSLDGYKNAADLILSEISSVSGLAPHYLGILSNNPTSADSLRASEASLTAKAEAKQSAFGRPWEAVARLMVCVRDGANFDDVAARVKWNDPGTRSQAQEADAVTKLYATKILSRTGALRRLGFTEDEIRQELADRSREIRNESEMGVFYASQGQEFGGNEAA